jgi:hypothetical protein
MKRRVPCLDRIQQAIGWRADYALDDIIRDVIKDRKELLGMD